MFIKTALTVLLAMMTFAPNTSKISVKSNQLHPEIINQQLRAFAKSSNIAARFNLNDETSDTFHYKSGIQYLPNYLPGDEKPEFLPNQWKNYLKLIEPKGSD